MSARTSSWSSLAAAAWLALAFAGCGGPPPPPPVQWSGPGPSAPEALARLEKRNDAYRSVRAALELVWHSESPDSTRSCRGSLSWVPPDSLRLRGTTAAFFTVFDLVSDARDVRLDIPREGVVVFGRRDDPAWSELPLSARELRVALRADPCEDAACRQSVRWESEDPPVLRGADWRLALDPDTGLPREWHRDGATRVVRWDEWSVRDGVAWPLRLEIRDLSRGEVLEVRMGRVDLDRPIPPGRFALEVEEGREILTPNEAKIRLDRNAGLGWEPE